MTKHDLYKVSSFQPPQVLAGSTEFFFYYIVQMNTATWNQHWFDEHFKVTWSKLSQFWWFEFIK